MVQIINRPENPFGSQLAMALSGLGEQLQSSKKNKLLSELLAGGPISQPGVPGAPGVQQMAPQMDSARIIQAAKAAGANPNELMLLQRQLAQQETDKYRREKLELEKEKASSVESKPYLTKLDERVDASTDLLEPVNEIKDLLKSPDLQLGSINSLIPERWMNPNTQRLVTLLNKVVTKSSQLGKGVPSKTRLLLEQAAKPQIYQSREAFEANVNDVLKSLSRQLMEGDIRDSLIEKVGRVPKNIGTLVRKEMSKFRDFPATTLYSEGAVIKDPETKQFYKREGFRWVPVKGNNEEEI